MMGMIELSPGTVIDGWQVVGTLGTGGFGVVHHVLKDGQTCALKLALHREHSGDAGRTHARTLREMALLLLLDHPNLVKPQAFGHLPDGRVYLVLEHVEGWPLDQWVERTHPTAQEVTRVFMKLAATLVYLHGQGVLHRDLKLTNVLIRQHDAEPILIDLGAATHERAAHLTDAGLPPGTDRYRAPEALSFVRKLRRSGKERYTYRVADEVFALGVMLYEVLTQARPTEHRPLAELNSPRRVLPVAAPHETNPRVPVALSELTLELLALEPKRRPQDMEAVRRELMELVEHQGREYSVPVHPPSEQHLAEDGERPVVEPLQEHRSAKLRVLVGMAVALMVAAGVSLWLTWDGSPPMHPGPPHVRSIVAHPPLPMPVPTRAPDPSPTVPVTASQEGSPVKSKTPDVAAPVHTARALIQASATRETSFTVWCRAATLTVAMSAGCTGVQLRPEPFVCPPGAQQAMAKLGWYVGDNFSVKVDDRASDGHRREDDEFFYRSGPVVGVKDEEDLDAPNIRPLPPVGTRLSGRVYVVPGKTGLFGLGEVIVIYDRMKFPNQDDIPVCLAVREYEGLPIIELKGATAKALSHVNAYVVDHYPMGHH